MMLHYSACVCECVYVCVCFCVCMCVCAHVCTFMHTVSDKHLRHGGFGYETSISAKDRVKINEQDPST